MRIYGVADIHGSQYRLNIILEKILDLKPDLVVVCGDITQFGPADVAKNFLDQISVDTIAVHGNIDPDNIGEGIIDSKAEYIHLKQVMRHGVSFIGIGGGLEVLESNIVIDAKGREKPLGELLNPSSVLVTHVPPYNTMDRVFIGQHAGNKDLRELVDEFHPRLVLCGHIHENPGVIKVGDTTVVNCSIGKKTAGACIDLNTSIKVTILQ
jgi:Icc-related predicted phosphoesterase